MFPTRTNIQRDISGNIRSRHGLDDGVSHQLIYILSIFKTFFQPELYICLGHSIYDLPRSTKETLLLQDPSTFYCR